MEVENALRRLIDQSLQLEGRIKHFDAQSPLLGAVPELDSMGVVTLISAIEEHFGIAIADDDINGSTFATLGDLTAFIHSHVTV